MLDCFNFFIRSCFLATVWQFVFKWHKQFIKVSIYMFCLTALQRLCISFSSFIQKNTIAVHLFHTSTLVSQKFRVVGIVWSFRIVVAFKDERQVFFSSSLFWAWQTTRQIKYFDNESGLEFNRITSSYL